MVIVPKFFNISWWIHCWQIIASSFNKKGWNFFFSSLIQFSKLLDKQHYGPSISGNFDNLKSNWNLEALVKHRLYLIADYLYQKPNVCRKESQQIFSLVTTNNDYWITTIELLLKSYFIKVIPIKIFFLVRTTELSSKSHFRLIEMSVFLLFHACNQT